MILFKKNVDLINYLQQARDKGLTIGFVPTMGALHEGHLSLLEASRKENLLTVTSIFVNPTQFNDPRDYEKYPSTIEKDIELLEGTGNDVLFFPPVTEIYPNGIAEQRHYDIGYLETILEGKFRPGHFQGVCNVMERLLDIVRPDNLYMGRKDYQQCMVIKRLLQIMQSDIILHRCSTLREPDGLAMSSRNLRLNPTERKQATVISQALQFMRTHVVPGETNVLKKQAAAMLEQHDFRIDYVEIANADTLALVDAWDGKQPIIGLIAAFQHEIRLIDNINLSDKD